MKTTMTSEEIKQYITWYVDKRFNHILNLIDALETKCKVMAQANAELIRGIKNGKEE